MYRRISSILFPIVLAFFIGTAIWGFGQHRTKNTVQIKAENQYQRAFHDLAFHMDQLHSQLGSTLVASASSQAMHQKSLLNVWRLTSQAQNEINELPLTNLPLNQTESFLSNMAKFSYNAAVQPTAKKASDGEMKTLNSLYQESGSIAGKLRELQGKVLSKKLRFLVAEQAMSSRKQPMDNTIIDGFKSVNKKLTQYSEVDWGPSVVAANTHFDYSRLKGGIMTASQIKQKAMTQFHLQGKGQLTLSENGKNTRYQSYTVKSKGTGRRKESFEADYTKKGGHLLWFMKNRPVKSEKLDVRQANDAAVRFLSGFGLNDMIPVSFDTYEGTANVTLAREKSHVIIYPEKVLVKIALDNGEVLGMHAIDYVKEHHARTIKKPKLTAKQAEKSLNPQFQIYDSARVVIKNSRQQDISCYQFSGRMNGQNYRVYVNADNGLEEQIELLRTDKPAA